MEELPRYGVGTELAMAIRMTGYCTDWVLHMNECKHITKDHHSINQSLLTKTFTNFAIISGSRIAKENIKCEKLYCVKYSWLREQCVCFKAASLKLIILRWERLTAPITQQWWCI